MSTGYRIVSSENLSIEQFQLAINDLINKGWSLVGGPFCAGFQSSLICQALYRPAETQEATQQTETKEQEIFTASAAAQLYKDRLTVLSQKIVDKVLQDLKTAILEERRNIVVAFDPKSTSRKAIIMAVNKLNAEPYCYRALYTAYSIRVAITTQETNQ